MLRIVEWVHYPINPKIRKEFVMLNANENSVGKLSDYIPINNPWWANTVALLHPLKASLQREQSEGMSDNRDLMRMMIAELNKKQQAGSTIHVDVMGAAVRPGDLSAQFDPRMDQLINLFTGGGDEMVIIV